MIRTTIHDRRIEIPAPDDLPDGTEVEIELTPVLERMGVAESEACDTAQSLDDWSKWLTTIESVDFAEPDAFDERFRQANIEAVMSQIRTCSK